MHLNLDNGHEDAYRISAYDTHNITINDEEYQQSLIISPNKLVVPWEPCHWQQLTPEHFLPILALNPQVVLIGTGASHQILQTSLLKPLIAKGLNAEVMSTPAACRTYNLLMAENRHVVAGLIIS